jgi:C1A family cysteine protease
MSALMLPLPISSGGRRYGAIPSVKDHRDKSILSSKVKAQEVFPPKFSIEEWCGPVHDQGAQGSCTGNAAAALNEFITRKFLPPLTPVLSPSFVYYLERQLEGTLDQGDCGAQVRSAVQILNQYGACLLKEEAYDPADFSTAPSADDITDGRFYALGSYHSVGNNILAMKSSVMSYYPPLIGIAVYDSFESDAAAASGLIPLPDVNNENLLGGHCVLAGIAFDDSIQCPGSPNPGAFKFQNSWGTSWGLSGRGWISYDYLANQNLTSDAWMQQR